MNLRRIALIDVDDASAAQLLRAHLEHLGFEVALNRPGKPSDFFSAFGFYGQPADAAIIAAHGDERGFIFPGMAEGVDDLVLPENRITPEHVTDRLGAAPPLIVSTACSTGSAAFARAFAQAGAQYYIAPLGDPWGRDIPLWIAAFAHALTGGQKPLPGAIAAANALMQESSRFRTWS